MKFLIVTLRYFGDCLIAASFAPALKKYFPDSQVDLLTFNDNKSILTGIKAIDHVIGVEHHPNRILQAIDHLKSWNTYDWSLITMPSTRMVLYGYFAAKHQSMWQVGMTKDDGWKKVLVTDQTPNIPKHYLDGLTQLLLPIIRNPQPLLPVAPDQDLSPEIQDRIQRFNKYVVCNPCSRFQDKNWSISGWQTLFTRLQSQGIGICLSGGNSDFERKYIQAITAHLTPKDYFSLAGKASFGQVARVIKHSIAYLGVDTATSHLAAATGIPCICLFGPSSSLYWGPSPALGRPQQFQDSLGLQTVLNVTIVRQDHPQPCAGCHQHRCIHHTPSELSRCMQSITVDKVWGALSKAVSSI